MCAMLRLLLFSLACACTTVVLCGEGDSQDRFVASLIQHLNHVPERAYLYEEGILVSAQKKSDNVYEVEANVKAVDPSDAQQYKLLKCRGEVVESSDGLTVSGDTAGCREDSAPTAQPEAASAGDTQAAQEGVTRSEETTSEEGQSGEEAGRGEGQGAAVVLDHEVLPSNQATSGEQFVAVRREHSGPCAGCSSLVSITAPGVADIAQLAVRHIDRHEPGVVHRLRRLHTVERQVQVVNGVRYILTFDIDFDTCSIENSDGCLQTKACRVSILEKPWLKLPDGSKFRAILSNNCTKEYLFGDNGEVLPAISENSSEKDNEIDVNFNPDNNRNEQKNSHTSPTPDYDAIANSGSADDILKVVHNKELQATIPHVKKELNDEEIKILEAQIIPYSESPTIIKTEEKANTFSIDSNTEPSLVKKSVANETLSRQTQSSLSPEQKNALNGLRNYFNFDEHNVDMVSNTHSNMMKSVNEADEKLDDAMNIKNNNLAKRTKRMVLGGVTEVSITDPEIIKLSEDSLQKYEQLSNSQYKQMVVKITSATRQVVAGTKHKITFLIASTKCLISDGSVCEVLDGAPVRQCSSEIWNRPWLKDGKQIKVTCDNELTNIKNNDLNKRTKRNAGFVKGGVTEASITDPEIIKLAKDSLQKYEQLSKSQYKQMVVKITSATRQVVAGTKHKITFLITSTKCLHNNPQNSDGSVCEPLDVAPVRQCSSEIWNRPWLEDGKQITVTCDDESTSIKNNDLIKRMKRNAGLLIGGVTAASITDPEIIKMAEDSLQKYEQLSNSQYKQMVVKIISATTQVVAGTKHKITFLITSTKCLHNNPQNSDGSVCEPLDVAPVRQCSSEIWNRPWLEDGKQITVTCDDESTSIKNNDLIKRMKRNAGLLIGGVTAASITDPEIIKMAEDSLQKYEQLSNSQYKQMVVKIISATTQVVAGTKHKITFLIASTKCLITKTQNSDGSVCEVLDGTPVRQCSSEIWNRPWLKDGKQITVTCDDESTNLKNNNLIKRTKRNAGFVTGGVTEASITDPKIIKLAEQSLQEYEQLSKSQYKQMVVKIISATRQVVAGTLHKVTFLIASTKCLITNPQNNDGSLCELLDGAPVRQCSSEIWNRPWLKDGKQIKVTCDNELTNFKNNDLNKRTKRNAGFVKGGVTEASITDPEIIKLAEDSLQKYEQLSNSQYKQMVVQITSATRQVVAGSLHKITFLIASTKCLLINPQISDCSVCEPLDGAPVRQCSSEIWNRPWLEDGKQITVKCDNDSTILTNYVTRSAHTYKANVNDAEIIKLTKESIHHLEQLSSSPYKQKLIKITSAVIKPSDEIRTSIDFHVVYTNCLLNDNEQKSVENCGFLDGEQIRKCHSIIWSRPWNKETKRIKVSCDSIFRRRKREVAQSKPKHFFTEYSLNSINDFSQRKIRDIPVISSELYGLEDMTMVHRAIDILNSRKSDGNLMKLLKVRSVKRDMNNALLHIFFDLGHTSCIVGEKVNMDYCEILEGISPQHCHAKIFKRRIHDTGTNDELNVYCNEHIFSLNHFFKDGSWFNDGNADIVENRKQAQLSLDKLTDTMYKMKALKVLAVSVSEADETGKSIVFLAAFTNCSIHHPISRLSECKVLKKKIARLCQAEFWTRGYMESTIQCENLRRNKRTSQAIVDNRNFLKDKRASHGHKKEDYRLIARNSLKYLELSSNTNSRQKVVRVNKVESLDGGIIKIEFDAAFTECSKYETVENVDACRSLINPPHRNCTSLVWSREWLKQGKAIDVKCEDNIGLEPDDHEIALQLAELSLKHVEAKYIHPNKQNIVRIVSMDKQVISGMHYRIRFEVGFTDCLVFDNSPACQFTNLYGPNKFCKANVWLRPWLNQSYNIRVTCKLDDDTLLPSEINLHLQAEKLFEQFLSKHRRNYTRNTDEFSQRFSIFKDNIRRIHEMNIREMGTAKYGVTEFTDLTYMEFAKRHTGLRRDLKSDNVVPMSMAHIPSEELPESFDWRDKGAVTPVKNQGSCGSCWAFSVTGNIEGQYKIETGKLLSLSEQELIDCDKLDDGCNGGLPDNAYRAIEQLGGLEEENQYPYDGENEKCKFDAGQAAVKISGAVNISSSEPDMAQWLFSKGPISIGINANAMQFYMGGVSHPWKMLCDPKNLDHGVLIVGYGVKNYPLFHKTLPYWIVKNSWGESWGERGYYRVYRGDGTCGLNLMASSAVVNGSRSYH